MGWQEGQRLKKLAPTPDLIDDFSSVLTTFMTEENWLPRLSSDFHMQVSVHLCMCTHTHKIINVKKNKENKTFLIVALRKTLD